MPGKCPGCWHGSFADLGIDEDGDRAVVEQVDFHVRSEHPGSYRVSQVFADLLQESFVEGNGCLPVGRTDVGGAVAFDGRRAG